MRVENKLALVEPSNAPMVFMFKCPGCKEHHSLNDTWTWNGDTVRPTFSPSVLVSNGDPAYRCHSFVRDGMIQFLDDCHHELRGQTVELPMWEENA